MSHVFDFKSIKQILDRQEQKAEFEAKNPEPAPEMYGWPYAIATTGAVPCVTTIEYAVTDEVKNLLNIALSNFKI